MIKDKNVEIGWNLDNSYARLPKSFFANLEPTPVKSPELKILNESLAKRLGLNIQELRKKDGVGVFAGNQLPQGASPLAQAYAGHQFGHFTMLGDGRAILLGEQMTPSGERFDIQLKGSGPTPFSRGGDGRATLGPMLREYIISEAMHALGIPTTRSLAVVTTGEAVLRETALPGAILTRVAASHLRVGTFQYAAGKDNVEELRIMADYAYERHFSDVEEGKSRYLSLLERVIKRQASLIAKWQLVGFIHGVMNTDNMTISGETIDYGPCAFMDEYDPATVFSSIDREGRYAYGNQPSIAAWNLARFAETLLPLLDDNKEKAIEMAEDTLSEFPKLYEQYWLDGMRAKLGIFNEEEADETLVSDLLKMMQKYKADYTNTFRALTFDNMDAMVLFSSSEFNQWYEKWQNRLKRQQETNEEITQLMQNNNPAVIPRNHRVEEAIDAAVEKEDFSVLEQLMAVLAKPYAHTPDQDEYATLPPPSKRPFQTFCGT